MAHLRKVWGLALTFVLASCAAPAFSQSVATAPRINTTVGGTAPAQGALLVGSNGVEKGTVANPLVVTGSTGGGGGGSADVGTPNTTAPTSASQGAGRTTAGNLVVNCVDTAGKACVPVAGVADRIITKTNLAANTSTIICPTATAPLAAVEIQISGDGLGLGMNGQTLTSGIQGTTTSSSDFRIPNALGGYNALIPPTNAITGYGPAQIVTCVQTLRQ